MIFDAAKYLQEDDDRRQGVFAADEDNWSNWEHMSWSCVYYTDNDSPRFGVELLLWEGVVHQNLKFVYFIETQVVKLKRYLLKIKDYSVCSTQPWSLFIASIGYVDALYDAKVPEGNSNEITNSHYEYYFLL